MLQNYFSPRMLAATALVILASRPLFATTIGTGQTVTAASLAGQNIDFDSTLTYVSTGTNAPYDAGAGLVNLSPVGFGAGNFTNSLGTGANQVQWQGSGGFTSTSNFVSTVNIGGLSTPATLTWGIGGFVPSGSALVLAESHSPNTGGVNFENNINLGTDASATRQIDIGGYAYLSGQITGSGNLLLQDYGPYKGGNVVLHPDAALDPTINVAGEVTLNNVIIPLSGLLTAGSFNLMNGAQLMTIVVGTTNMTLSGSSIWGIPKGILPNDSNQDVGALNSDDAHSVVIMGENNNCILTVHSGYYAGQLRDDSTTTGVGGSLVKDGPGIFTLANDNSGGENGGYGYTQGTTVKQGLLLVTNTTGSGTGTGAVTVQSGGSLGGTGILAPTGTSNIVVQSGGKVDLTAFDPAYAPSKLTNALTLHLTTTNSAIFQTGAVFAFDLGPGGDCDELAFTGLTADKSQIAFNNNEVDLNFLTGAGPGTYTLFSFDASGAYSGTLQNGSGYSFTYNPADITVTIAEAPEPSRWTYLSLGIGLLWLLSQRCTGNLVSILRRERQRVNRLLA